MAQGDIPPKYASPRSSGNDTHCSHAASGHVFLVWLLCVGFGCLRVIYLLKLYCSIAPVQYLGAPLYIINRDYYYRWMTCTKQQMTLLILSMTQWWTSTRIHVSGDESVREELRKLRDGRLQCKFASRMVLIANHQVPCLSFRSSMY